MMMRHDVFTSAEAAFLARLLAHPLDTIRARLIMGSQPLALFRGSFAGLLPGLAVSVPGGSAYLLSYHAARESKLLSGFDPVEKLICSAIVAEAVSGLIFTPFEIMKQKKQVIDVNSNVKSFDWKKCQRGYFVNLVAFVPFSIIFFGLHERLQNKTPQIVSSTVSAAVASAITFPLDVVKTRIQVNDATLVDAMKNVRFSGFVPRVLFATVNTGVCVGLFGMLRQ